MGVHVGILRVHLMRLRSRSPGVYDAMTDVRRLQLAGRHLDAEKRADAHSRHWHRKQARRRFFEAHGHWPWE